MAERGAAPAAVARNNSPGWARPPAASTMWGCAGPGTESRRSGAPRGETRLVDVYAGCVNLSAAQDACRASQAWICWCAFPALRSPGYAPREKRSEGEPEPRDSRSMTLGCLTI